MPLQLNSAKENNDLFAESLVQLFAHKNTRSVNQLFLYNLLTRKDSEFRGKRAKTVCMHVERLFRKKVTVAEVKRARKEVQDAKKS